MPAGKTECGCEDMYTLVLPMFELGRRRTDKGEAPVVEVAAAVVGHGQVVYLEEHVSREQTPLRRRSVVHLPPNAIST